MINPTPLDTQLDQGRIQAGISEAVAQAEDLFARGLIGSHREYAVEVYLGVQRRLPELMLTEHDRYMKMIADAALVDAGQMTTTDWMNEVRDYWIELEHQYRARMLSMREWAWCLAHKART